MSRERLGPQLAAKRAALRSALAVHSDLVVAFSGGVDSSYLLAEAVDVLGERCIAVTAVSASLAPAERAGAAEVAAALGARHLEVVTREQERPGYVANGPDRCFHCKSELFDRVDELVRTVVARAPTARPGAREVTLGSDDRGAVAVAVGTIVDDLGDHRPGQRAAVERGVHTPLADAGFTKIDVRAAAAALGLAVADKPAQACLASRIAYGTAVTPQRLARVATAEAWLDAHGFAVRRVRDLGEVASVEVAPHEVARVTDMLTSVRALATQLGWNDVTIDPRGYRQGALNELLPTI